MNRLLLNHQHVMGWLLLLACSWTVLGCGTSEVPKKEISNQPGEKAVSGGTDKLATNPARAKLVGLWLGVAYLDEGRLSERLLELDPEKREQVLQSAESFISTAIVYQFNDDGTLTSEVEIVPPGSAPIVDSITGEWEVLAANGSHLVVKNKERLQDGTIVESEKSFNFLEGDNNLSLKVALGEVLHECNPLIIFERQQPQIEKTADGSRVELK